jgi:hypothetical protein
MAISILSIIGIGIYYSFFQNQKKAAAPKSLEKQTKTVQPATMSATASDIPEKRQNGDFYLSGNQNGSKKGSCFSESDQSKILNCVSASTAAQHSINRGV